MNKLIALKKTGLLKNWLKEKLNNKEDQIGIIFCRSV
jgi:hypothetical protein